MSRPQLWPWVRPFLVMVMVVSLPPLLYWFGYVQSSVQAAKRQGHSALSAVATEFTGRIEAVNPIAANAHKLGEARRLQAYLESVLTTSTIVTTTVAPTDGDDLLAVGADGLRVKADLKAALVPLADLVPWDVVETEFDGLLVLDADGKLLAQDRRLPRQPLSWLVPLRGIRLADFADSSAMPAGAREASVDAKVAPPANSRGFRGPFDFRDDTTLRLAGVDYLAFVQRVSPFVTRANGERGNLAPLFVCGLIEQSRLRQTAIGLAPQTLIAAGALIAFGLFAIPFLKLRFIGERERMRQRDVWLLGGSVLSATALLVLVILDGHAVMTLRDRFDAGLQQFRASVVAHLTEETAAATRELRTSTPLLLAEESHQPMPKVERSACAPGSVGQDLNVGSVLARATPAFSSYPDFEAIFLTDLCGIQTRKWMVRTDPTPLIDVSPQPYFSAALTATSDSIAPGQSFKFATSVTPTSGLSVGRYMLPMTTGAGEVGVEVAPQKRVGLAVFVTPLWSVTSPVVAEPFQFVLVNRDGEVAFQKTEASFRGERFFDAVSDGQALERAARSPETSPQPQTHWYRGRAYRMTAIDIPSLELTLVAYYERAVVGSLATRMFGTAAPFAVGIVASMLLGAALSVILFRRRALEWAWPTSQRTGLYLVGGLACIVSAFVLLLARAYLPSIWLASFILVMPVVVIVALGFGKVTDRLDRLHAVLRPALSKLIGKSRFKPAFHSFAVLALLAFVAWPTAIVFDDAFRLHAAAFEADISEHWRLAETKWNDDIKNQWVNVGAPLAEFDDTNSRQDLRSKARRRNYASAENYQTLLASRSARSTYSDCANLRVDAGCDVRKTLPPPFSLTVRAAAALTSMNPSRVGLATTLARFADSQSELRAEPLLHGFQPSLWGVVGMIVLIGGAILLVRSVGHHVLGIDFTDERMLESAGHFTCANGTRWLLLRPSPDTLARHNGTLVVQNLRGTQPVPFELPAAGVTLQVQGIEARLSDPTARAALLELLRQPVHGCLVLVSEIDPLHYLTQKVREACDDLGNLAARDDKKRVEAESECRKLRDELAGWAVALRDVHKIRENLPPPSPQIRKATQLSERLQDECGNMTPLIEIGTQLRARTDFDALHWEQVVDFLFDAAEPYYRSIWELCSREERLVLIQLAQDGLVNPKRHDLVRRLARRGLIILDPRYRLMNRSFARFVAEAEPRARVAEWERTSSGVSWARLGTPLYALAGVVIAILLFTEQALLTNILAVAATAAGALSSLRGLQASVAKPVASEVKVA